MLKISSIALGKLVLFIGKLFNRGGILPGFIASKIKKDILRCLEKPKISIAVSGSSGKGSTARLIAQVIKDCGYKVAYNSGGSNMKNAVTTTLLENCNFFGKTKAEIAILEIDERYLKLVYPEYQMDYLVITNITRDQPPRQKHCDLVYEEMTNGLSKETKLILNGDDPYISKFEENGYQASYYGIAENSTAYRQNKFPSLYISRCPLCHHKLLYNYYHFEHLGDFRCSSCSFKRPALRYEMTAFDTQLKQLTINDEININIDNDMISYRYNVMAAFTMVAELSIATEKIASCLSAISHNHKVYDYYSYYDKKVYILNTKVENAPSYNQALLYASQKDELKTFISGWHIISKRYPHDDISWLYDIEFELINNEQLEQYIVCGPLAHYIAVRLKYANIALDKIKIVPHLKDAEEYLQNAKGNIYAVVNYDYVATVNEVLRTK